MFWWPLWTPMETGSNGEGITSSLMVSDTPTSKIGPCRGTRVQLQVHLGQSRLMCLQETYSERVFGRSAWPMARTLATPTWSTTWTCLLWTCAKKVRVAQTVRPAIMTVRQWWMMARVHLTLLGIVAVLRLCLRRSPWWGAHRACRLCSTDRVPLVMWRWTWPLRATTALGHQTSCLP